MKAKTEEMPFRVYVDDCYVTDDDLKNCDEKEKEYRIRNRQMYYEYVKRVLQAYKDLGGNMQLLRKNRICNKRRF